MPLFTYCKKAGISYNTVIKKYLNEYQDKKDLSVTEAIKETVDYYLLNPPNKYFFNNQSLAKFCDVNNYPYLAIYRRIKILESKDLDREDIITTAIKKYEDKLQINKINEIFKNLKDNKITNTEEIVEICNFLKIDLENIKDLINMDFSLNQVINMIWYFSDKKTNMNNKIITDRKIKEIFTLANDLKEKKTDIQKIELYDLLGIYKSELYDSRIEMLQRQKGYIYKTLFSICGGYNIKISDSNYEEFENEIKYYLLTVIDRTSLNNYGQIIKYMDLTVKGYFRTYLKKYQKQNGVLSLDAARYSTKDGKEKARMEYIANPNSLSKKNQIIALVLKCFKLYQLYLKKIYHLLC